MLGLGLSLVKAGSIPRFLLDKISGAVAAYSTRKLKAAFTSDVVEVRRSGDSAESGFTPTEITNGTLASWVSAGGGTEDGFVVTWYDQSGNGNNATQGTAANQPQIVDSGGVIDIKFDGTNDYVEVGDVGSIESLVFWFKPVSEITSSSSVRSLFAFRDHAADKYYGIHTGASTGVISGEVLSILPDGAARTGTNTTLNAGQWYHFAVVWNSGSNYFDIYTNGTLTTDLSAGTHSLANWTDFRIGRDIGNFNPINCNIAKVAIWDTALSQSEITQIYNAGR